MKKSMTSIEPEFFHPEQGQLTPLVAHRDDLQAPAYFQAGHVIDHPGKGLRPGEHEIPELLPRKRPLLVKDRPVEILVEAQLPLFISAEREVVALIHLRVVEFERPRGLLPRACGPSRS